MSYNTALFLSISKRFSNSQCKVTVMITPGLALKLNTKRNSLFCFGFRNILFKHPSAALSSTNRVQFFLWPQLTLLTMFPLVLPRLPVAWRNRNSQASPNLIRINDRSIQWVPWSRCGWSTVFWSSFFFNSWSTKLWAMYNTIQHRSWIFL